MSIGPIGDDLPRVNRFGGTLIVLAIVAVVVAYPPPSTGIAPLLGVGNLFLPLFVSVASLLMAIVGSVFLARNIAEAQSERTQRLLIRVSFPLIVVVVIGLYLTTVAGFGLQSPFIIGAGILAIVAGVTDEFLR